MIQRVLRSPWARNTGMLGRCKESQMCLETPFEVFPVLMAMVL